MLYFHSRQTIAQTEVVFKISTHRNELLALNQCCRLLYVIFRIITCFSSERQDTAFSSIFSFLVYLSTWQWPQLLEKGCTVSTFRCPCYRDNQSVKLWAASASPRSSIFGRKKCDREHSGPDVTSWTCSKLQLHVLTRYYGNRGTASNALDTGKLDVRFL